MEVKVSFSIVFVVVDWPLDSPFVTIKFSSWSIFSSESSLLLLFCSFKASGFRSPLLFLNSVNSLTRLTAGGWCSFLPLLQDYTTLSLGKVLHLCLSAGAVADKRPPLNSPFLSFGLQSCSDGCLSEFPQLFKICRECFLLVRSIVVLGGDQVTQTEDQPDLESSHGPWPRRTGRGPLRPRSAESVEAAKRLRERFEAWGHQPSGLQPTSWGRGDQSGPLTFTDTCPGSGLSNYVLTLSYSL